MASVIKRGNTYTIRVSLGYAINGKQIQKFTTWKPSPGMTKAQIEKELERQKILFEEKCRSGRVLDSSTRFGDYAEYWMQEYAEKQLRASTISGYKLMLRRIVPALGHIRLEKLQPKHLMEFYNNLREGGIRDDVRYTPAADFAYLLKERNMTKTDLKDRAHVSGSVVTSVFNGSNVSRESAKCIADTLRVPVDRLFEPTERAEKPLSGRTVLHYHRLISSMLEKAVKWQIIFSNPCARVEAPKAEKKEANYLDEKQAAHLLDCLQNEPLKYRAMITLLLYSGMRRGELCGLTWSDVDFEENIIDINKSSLYVTGSGTIEDTTKTFSSQRVIKIPSPVMEILHEHRREQLGKRLALGDKWEDSGKVFTQWNGSPIYPGTVTSWFAEFVKRNDLPHVSIHSLRHTNATLLIANGTDLRTVSKRLGHSNMTTTGNIYTHAIQTADERAAETLNDILTLREGKKSRRA